MSELTPKIEIHQETVFVFCDSLDAAENFLMDELFATPETPEQFDPATQVLIFVNQQFLYKIPIAVARTTRRCRLNFNLSSNEEGAKQTDSKFLLQAGFIQHWFDNGGDRSQLRFVP